MDPILGASLIGGGANLLQNLFNLGGASGANRRQIEFWKMQNEYNRPINQVARLKEAGLNPALMYGKAASPGIAQGVGQAQRANYQVDNPMPQITQFADIGLKEAQTNNFQAMNTVNVQRAAQIAMDTAFTSQKAMQSAQSFAWNKADRANNKELLRISVDAAKEDLRQQQHKTFEIFLDNQLKSGTLRNNIIKSYYELELMKKNGQYKDAQIALMKQLKTLRSLGLDKAPWYGRWLYENGKDIIPPEVLNQGAPGVIKWYGSQPSPSTKGSAFDKYRKKKKPKPYFGGVSVEY